MTASHPVESGSARTSLIDVRSVTKIYGSGSAEVRALDDISLTIAPGEFISVLGPSGCGKTTLMMIVVGLTTAQAGEIHIAGKRVTRPYTDLGIVFQNAELLEWRTAIQNIMLQIEIRRLPVRDYLPRALELLSHVGLDGFADSFPSGLSGGMKQRVALCRALVHDPEILLMDEPFGALDALTRDQMNLDLQHLWMEKRKTAIMITHSIDEAVFLSDRIFVMTPRPGRIAEEVIVDLPRPRTLEIKDTPAFAAYCGNIRKLFKDLGVFKP